MGMSCCGPHITTGTVLYCTYYTTSMGYASGVGSRTGRVHLNKLPVSLLRHEYAHSGGLCGVKKRKKNQNSTTHGTGKHKKRTLTECLNI